MASVLSGSPEEIRTAAGNATASLQLLESQLTALAGCHQGLLAAIQSEHTGKAVDNALHTAWNDGKSLATTLQNIIQVMGKVAVNTGIQDEQGAARVAAQMAVDNGALTPGHTVDVGSW